VAGRPVTVAAVAVVPAEHLGRTHYIVGEQEGTTRRVQHRTGQFEIEPLAAGTYDLLVTTPAGGACRVPGLTLAAGEERAGLRVVVGPALTIEGRVLAFPTDAPLAQAAIAIVGAGPHVETR